MSVEDIQFDKLFAEKQRKELNAVLEKLANSLQQKESVELISIMEQLKQIIEKLATNIKEEKVKSSLGEETILYKAVEDLKKYIKISQIKKEWEIEFTRDSAGFLQSPIRFVQK